MRVNNRQAKDAVGSGNFNVQASLDVRDIATMAEFLVANGEVKEGKYGQIVSWCFELGLSFLRKNYATGLHEYESIEQALGVLNSMHYSVDQFKAGGNRQLVKGMANEAMQMDFGSGIRAQQYVAGAGTTHTLDLMSAPTQPTVQYVPSVPEPKPVDLNTAIQLAQVMYQQNGFKHPDFLWLWDKTLPDPRVSQETRDFIAANTTDEQLDKLMEAQEYALRPPTAEAWDLKLRAFAIDVIVKNATSSQQVAIKPEIAHLVTDPYVIAEAQPKIQEWLVERERLQVEKEEEKLKAKEQQR